MNENLLELFERKDFTEFMRPYKKLKTRNIPLGTKTVLIGKFLTTQKAIGATIYPTDSVTATQVFDLTSLVLGYIFDKSVVYAYKNIDVDFNPTLGESVISDGKEPKTIDYFSYLKDSNRLIHVLGYSNKADHYFHTPKLSVILADKENPDFKGREFDRSKLDETQNILLDNELEGLEVKEVDKLEILRALYKDLNECMKSYSGNWKEFVNGTIIR